MSFLSHLECTYCSTAFEADRTWNLCTRCNKPLFARYDLKSARKYIDRAAIPSEDPTLWRYAELLPVRKEEFRLSLGEGWTPLVEAARLGKVLGSENLYIKDESANPTCSFKARGLSVAVSRALELGVSKLSIPSAGNAAGAMSAYAALAGLEAHVFMPRDVPGPFLAECVSFGAHVKLVDGLIGDCAAAAAKELDSSGRFDMSTLKEPYRVEGKKTMGYELAEQSGWSLPDVIIYPTGGGTGLIGMWKAFSELEELGWIESRRPRMVAVQAEGCAPIVRAFREGSEFAEPWEGASTIAAGLRVPSAVGDFLILRALRESGGTAVSVPDEEMMVGAKLMGRTEGIFACPEGGATLAAFHRLRRQGWIRPGERVVLFNTGSGHKYYELWLQKKR